MKIIYYEVAKTPSTNAEAKKLMHLWDPKALTVVTTQNQTAGKGKFGRDWKSSNRDIIVTYCFFITEMDIDLSQLFRLGTKAVLMLTQELQIPHATIKWPNDVLVQGEKLCGVLCETLPSQGMLGIALGIGINANTLKEDLQNVGQPATSLQILLGYPVVLEHSLECLTTHFIRILEKDIAKVLATKTNFWNI
ncbi:biotin--[acetyl-CoA-carboxylase] ligase [Chlamydia sp. 17-3921]|uniref:biotin--[acetyl-CoA-carboxylase] ligase n=1 Tax=Chlamydia sp. 17-3921 TaxID=2675798 RepID=UPI0019191FDA|nr:biotin--[acetyl-CoA-carboxylase] ligase [Chlamydia sp. 17-3921]